MSPEEFENGAWGGPWAVVSYQCLDGEIVRYIKLTNFPVFMATYWPVEKSAVAGFNQALVFHLLNGTGIVLLWYYVGAFIDLRIRRKQPQDLMGMA